MTRNLRAHGCHSLKGESTLLSRIDRNDGLPNTCLRLIEAATQSGIPPRIYLLLASSPATRRPIPTMMTKMPPSREIKR